MKARGFEDSGDFTKAHALYETLRDQSSVKDDDVSLTMLNDELRYVKTLARQKFSEKPGS